MLLADSRSSDRKRRSETEKVDFWGILDDVERRRTSVLSSAMIGRRGRESGTPLLALLPEKEKEEKEKKEKQLAASNLGKG